MSNVVACIDGSPSSPAVCDCAGWAARRLSAPLTLLHVLDRARFPTDADLSGSIGLGSREALLEQLAALDEQRSRLALEQGRLMLDTARKRVTAGGAPEPALLQRHGDLIESLEDMSGEIRLLVIGKQGDQRNRYVGSQVESVLRTLQRPILLTPEAFQPPRGVLLAFDASAVTRRSVELLAASPLLRGLPVHVVTVGSEDDATREAQAWARQVLEAAGFEAHTAVLTGEVEPALSSYQTEHGLDLLVMGAYSQSRIREFFLGSTTEKMLRNARTPLLVLR